MTVLNLMTAKNKGTKEKLWKEGAAFSPAAEPFVQFLSTQGGCNHLNFCLEHGPRIAKGRVKLARIFFFLIEV